jgi:hypothetical protein
MKTTKELRKALRSARKHITTGLWGIYGVWQNNQPPEPEKNVWEASPGLSIGSTGKVEHIARFSGTGHDVQANVNYTTLAVNYLNDALDDIDELEEENEILRERALKDEKERN